MSTRERKAPVGTIAGPCMDTTWQTPPELLDAVRAYFGGPIPFDAATALDNPTRALAYCTEQDSGLTRPWPERGTFCNPPYGSAIRDWYAKIEREARRGREVVAVLPTARWEQGYFQAVLSVASLLCLVRKRVAFVRAETGDRPGGNTYGTMFVGWNCDEARWVPAFRGIGACYALRGLTAPPDMPNRGPDGEAPPEQAALFDGATTP